MTCSSVSSFASSDQFAGLSRRRRSRRPFYPSAHVGGEYRMPELVTDRLGSLLQGRRNAEACWTLAVHLARCNAGSRLLEAFPVSRRGFDESGGLLELEGLGLTERQIRSAVKALEEIGFLVRDIPKGNGWQKTSSGMRKAPIRYRFGPEFFPLFLAASRFRRRVPGGRTKCPGRADLLRKSEDQGQLSSGSDQGQTAPASPKGFPIGRVAKNSAPDLERAGALAHLASLKANPIQQGPLSAAAVRIMLPRERR